MANVVVVGAGLGGLPAAYELRHGLSRDHIVTLISDRPEFTFIPGLIRVALGLKPLRFGSVGSTSWAELGVWKRR